MAHTLAPPFMTAGGEHGQRGKSSTQLASSQTSAGKESERKKKMSVIVCVAGIIEECEHACVKEEVNRKDVDACKSKKRKISSPWSQCKERTLIG